MDLKRHGLVRGVGAVLAGTLAVWLADAWAGGAEQPPLERVGVIELKGKPGPLDHLTVDSVHNRLLVANQCNDTLDVVDLKTGKLIQQVPGQKQVHGVAYAADLDRIFLGNGEGVCNVLDGSDYKLLKTLRVNDADNVHYDPRAHRAYVAGEKELAVIDAKSLKTLALIKLPGPPEGFRVATGRPRLYVNTSEPCQVAVVDTSKDKVITKYPLGGKEGNETLALDEAGKRIFVGCRGNPRIVVLARGSGKQVTSVAIPVGVDDMFFDAKAKRIYASCGSGFVAVVRQIDADHYRPVAKVPTVKGARTSYFDPGTGRLYVAVPRQAGKQGPEVWVFQTRP
jgi:DNA-binding beta-propeller fold protein YncE